jgi:hypothetical protein
VQVHARSEVNLKKNIVIIFVIWYSVLPGPEEALPPVEPKFTAIWRKYSAISEFFKIPLLFRYILIFS